MSQSPYEPQGPEVQNNAKLFTPIRLRELDIRNRLFVSPMCQYSAIDGVPNNWHLVHLGSRAVGGAGLVMVEATAVKPIGRISAGDTGIWNQGQVRAFKGITQFIKEHGAVPGVQLAHAGRKASTAAPWKGGHPVDGKDGGWLPEAPSALPFSDQHPVPHELTVPQIDALVGDFVEAAKRSFDAGFEVVEIHMAHGYLLHEFLSPLSNHRTDDYGGSLENRMRFPLKVAMAVRAAWPKKWPVFVRLSITDWAEGGWDLYESIEFSRKLKVLGIDLIDCSSGGIVPHANIPSSPGYQVPFSSAIRGNVQIATGAVGLITEPLQADEILQEGHADVIFIGRESLRDPYFPLHAAKALGANVEWPVQYQRAKV